MLYFSDNVVYYLQFIGIFFFKYKLLKLLLTFRTVDAGSDPHPKVKESAKAAMLDISSVIRNPEISRLTPSLLAALVRE